MIAKEFTSELERALVRPDVETLRDVLFEYFEFLQFKQQYPDDPDEPGYDSMVYESSDPDRALALVALAEANYDDQHLLGMIAVSPLEDILMFDPVSGATAAPSDEIFDRVMAEAKRNPRFRWMLGRIYTNQLRPDQQEIFDALISRSERVLPPRDTE